MSSDRDRLLKVLISEKRFEPDRVNDIVGGDLYKVLQNYMDIDRDDVKVRVDVDADGYYILRCKVRARRMKIFGIV